MVLALLLGIPTLRLRADYLAIVTIAAAEIIRLSYRATDAAQVDRRLGRPAALRRRLLRTSTRSAGSSTASTSGRSVQRRDELWVLLVGWTLVLVSCLVVCLLMRSPWGRVLKAIREDEDAVRSLGKNVFSYKMQSLVLGGVFGALGGLVFALDRQRSSPTRTAPSSPSSRTRS